jgi:8-oxo-dGTP pyrophosphatase MutT (NUDIX family)
MEQREAIVAVVRRGARVLVIQRGPLARLSGYSAPLSGKLEPGETQEEAVVREVHEEVGLRVCPVDLRLFEELPEYQRGRWDLLDVETQDQVRDEPGSVHQQRVLDEQLVLVLELGAQGAPQQP